jgi:hypothetical protein
MAARCRTALRKGDKSMDVHRFDALVRNLTVEGSRRRLLGLLGGTALGGLLATGFDHDAEAKKKKKKCKKKCAECQQCKKGKCKPKANGTTCSTGFCQDGTCIGEGNCPPAQVCEISEVCCPNPLINIGNVEVCETDSNQLVCGCLGGTTFCAYGGGEFGNCCEAGETCDPDDGCVAE